MRHYEGVIGLSNLNKDLKERQLARNLFVIDRFLKMISAAGIGPGQPTATGAGGGAAPPCCVNEVDEFELVNDATEGILSFGRAEGESEPEILSGHAYTRIEGWEHGTQLNLNGDTTAGSVSVQTTVKRTGSYALQITNDGVTASNVQMAFNFESGSGEPSTNDTFAAVAFRFYMRFSALPDATREIFKLWGSSVGALRTVVSMTSGGVLVLDATNGTTALATNTWYKITGTYDSVANAVTLLIDDAIEFNNVTAAGSGGAGVVLKLSFGKTANAGTYTMFVDDVALEGSTAIANITYPPSGGIYACPLAGNGQVQDVFATTGAATEWEACTAPDDADTSYIAVTGGTNVARTFTLDVPNAIRGKIHAVQWSNFIRTTTVVATTHRIVSAPSDLAEGSLTQLTTTSGGTSTTGYRMYSHLQASNPFSSAAWNRSAIESMVVGLSVTPGGGVTLRATTITIQVDVSEENGEDVARAIRVTPEDGHIIPAYLVNDGDTFGLSNYARLIAGQDGTNCQILLTDTSGRLMIGGPGTGATDLGKAEDSPHTSGDVGVMALAVRDDDPPAATAALGDYTPLLTDSTGRLWVNTELPDAAALGDADANPTTPRIGADLQAWNGASWYRAGGSAAAGLEVNVLKLPTAAALGDTDANPTTTKVGAAVMFVNEGTKTGTPTWNRNTGETHATDEAGNTDDAGLHISEIHKSFTVTLDNVSTAYDTNPETQTSTGQSTRRFRYAMLTFTLDSTGTPTDIVFDVEMSPDNSNWYKPGWGFLQDLRYDDTVCATAINEAILIEKLDRFVRLVVTATGGTGAGTKFDVTNAKITFFN